MKLKIVVFALALALATAAKNAFEVVQNTTGLSILARALNETGVGPDIGIAPNATLFAPTDDGIVTSLMDLGFTNVSANQSDRIISIFKALDSNTSVSLQDLLKYHAVPDRLNAANVTGNWTTKAGGSVVVNGTTLMDNEPALTDPMFVETDIAATNGFVHTINRVLFYTDITRAVNASQIEEINNNTMPTPTAEPGDPVCFPASSIVHTADGKDITMAELSAGHTVRVGEDATGYSRVFLFSHKQHGGMHTFVRVTAESGDAITLSPAHYLYANGKLTAARAVRVGDKLRTLKGVARVKTVERVRDFGLIAPHTMHGDIVVNGIVASTYTAVVHPRLAHWLLAPVRLVARAGLSKEPLGSALYAGAPRAARLVPSGPDRF